MDRDHGYDGGPHPGPCHRGIAAAHNRFALALNADRSLVVEDKGMFTGTIFFIIPWITFDHEVTVHPWVD